MDYLDGVALTDLDALRKMYGQDFDAERTLLNALNTWSLGVLSCDFFRRTCMRAICWPWRTGAWPFWTLGSWVGCLPESGQH